MPSPTPFTLRPPDDEDADAIASLLNQMAVELGQEPAATAADVRHSWVAPRFQRARHARVAVRDGRIVGAAALEPFADESRASGAVAPDHRGHGIGTALLQFLVDAARDDPDIRTLYVGANSKRPDALELFERFGFAHARTFLRMVHPSPASVGEPTIPDGIRIDTTLRGDALVDALIEAHADSFVDHWNFHRWEPDFLRFHLADRGTDPDLIFLSYGAGEAVAGFCICVLATDAPRGTVEVLGVTRPFRGIGLGAALLRLGVHSLAARGAAEVDLSVDAENLTGALGLYERAGFVVADENRVYALDVS